MWGILGGRKNERKRAKARPNVEVLDERVVPATLPFDPRTLAAQGAAELAMGIRNSPSLAAFNNFTRFSNRLDRLNAQFTTQLNRLSTRFVDQTNRLNQQLAARSEIARDLFPEFVTTLGRFDPTTGMFTRRNAVQQFNTRLNNELRARFGNSVVTTGNLRNGPFGVNGFDDGAFQSRINANFQRLSNQLNRQLNQFDRQFNRQVNQFSTSFRDAGPTFSNAADTLNRTFTTTLADFGSSLRTGLDTVGTTFSTGLTGVNTVFRDATANLSPTATFDTDLFQTIFGNEFGMFSRAFTDNVSDFSASFDTGFSTFTSDFDNGLGDFFDSLNSQFFTPAPGVGIPSTPPIV